MCPFSKEKSSYTPSILPQSEIYSLFITIASSFKAFNPICAGHRVRSSLSEERRESSMSDDRRYSYLMEQVDR